MQDRISTVPIVEEDLDAIVPIRDLVARIKRESATMKELVCPNCRAIHKANLTTTYKQLDVSIVKKELDKAGNVQEQDIILAMYGEELNKKVAYFTCTSCGKEADIVRWVASSAYDHNERAND